MRPLDLNELAALKLFANGKTADEMAAELGVSKSIAQHYLRVAARKLGARNRVHAVAIAGAHGPDQAVGRRRMTQRPRRPLLPLKKDIAARLHAASAWAGLLEALRRGRTQQRGDQVLHLLPRGDMRHSRPRAERCFVEVVERGQSARIEFAENHPLGQAIDATEAEPRERSSSTRRAKRLLREPERRQAVAQHDPVSRPCRRRCGGFLHHVGIMAGAGKPKVPDRRPSTSRSTRLSFSGVTRVSA